MFDRYLEGKGLKIRCLGDVKIKDTLHLHLIIKQMIYPKHFYHNLKFCVGITFLCHLNDILSSVDSLLDRSEVGVGKIFLTCF